MNSKCKAAGSAKAWPFAEARKLLARIRPEDDRPVVLQTGYGPSGLPHIGTFGEVARTSMVRRAFAELSDRPTRLICFSDDMDALRKVPENVPNREVLEDAIGLPLTRVPDPFGTHGSFGDHNNARLREFLDGFGFLYEFLSSTECYRSGMFDETLLRVLDRYEDVQRIMLPTLGEERRATYSPFLPISPRTGHVLQARVHERNLSRGTIVFDDECGERVEIPVTGGNVKLQWKPDWAMRWVALGVDYEMSGKDLIDSVHHSSAIAKAIGGRPPEGFSYEHFLDADGLKISKSKGNGISIEQWLAYAPPESLAYFMYANPTRAKRLHLDGILSTVDDYQRELAAYPDMPPQRRFASAIWHVHGGEVPAGGLGMSFRMLINLAAVTGASSKDVLWEFLRRYKDGLTPETHPELDRAAENAVRYSAEVIAPQRRWHRPSAEEARTLRSLRDALAAHTGALDAEQAQEIIYNIGNARCGKLRDWFSLLYRTLLGQEQGPRLGGFVAVYGIENTVSLINRALDGELAKRSGNRAESAG